jgi:hypothetical protein
MKNLIIIGVIAVLLLSIVGLAAAVFTSQTSLPGAPLYAFKLSIEGLRLRLTQDSASQMELKFEFANRRYDEIYQLASSKRVPPTTVITQLQNNIDQCLYLAAIGTEANQKVALERLRDRLQGQLQALQLLQSQTDSQISEVLAKVLTIISSRIQLADMGLTDPLTFRQQFSGQAGSPTSDAGLIPGEQGTETPSPLLSETPTPEGDQAMTETALAGSMTPDVSGTGTPTGGDDNPPILSQTPAPGISETPSGSETPPDDNPPGITPGVPSATSAGDDQPPGDDPNITATSDNGGSPGGDDDSPPGNDPIITSTPSGPPGDNGDNPPGT